MEISNFQWIFTETGHGKGAPDGVGASIKRGADDHVSKGGSIRSAGDIVQLVESAGSKVLVKEVSSCSC